VTPLPQKRRDSARDALDVAAAFAGTPAQLTARADAASHAGRVVERRRLNLNAPLGHVRRRCATGASVILS
jgi:hypothetical protein